MKDNLTKLGLGATPKLDIKEFPNKKCDHCGCEVFTKGYIFKQIPGTLVGNGGDTVEYPLTVLVCSKCNRVLSSDIRDFGINVDYEISQSENTSNTENIKPKSSLII